MEKNKCGNRSSPEVRERAVRMVFGQAAISEEPCLINLPQELSLEIVQVAAMRPVRADFRCTAKIMTGYNSHIADFVDLGLRNANG